MATMHTRLAFGCKTKSPTSNVRIRKDPTIWVQIIPIATCVVKDVAQKQKASSLLDFKKENQLWVMLVNVSPKPKASAALVGEVAIIGFLVRKLLLSRRQARTLITTRVPAQLPPVPLANRLAGAGRAYTTDSLSI